MSVTPRRWPATTEADAWHARHRLRLPDNVKSTGWPGQRVRKRHGSAVGQPWGVSWYLISRPRHVARRRACHQSGAHRANRANGAARRRLDARACRRVQRRGAANYARYGSWADIHIRTRLHRLTAIRVAPIVCIQVVKDWLRLCGLGQPGVGMVDQAKARGFADPDRGGPGTRSWLPCLRPGKRGWQRLVAGRESIRWRWAAAVSVGMLFLVSRCRDLPIAVASGGVLGGRPGCMSWRS